MRHLVIGNGEIGKALASVLGCDACDVEGVEGRYDVLHICFPFSKKFADHVAAYRRRHQAKYVIVHSTVPVGTCRELGVLHSPVTGVHPHLAESMKIFSKPVGGPGAYYAVRELRRFGIPAEQWPSSDDTEAGKLYALLIYGINVMLEKEAHGYCEALGLSHQHVYRRMASIYNRGYGRMGMGHFRMYELKHVDGPLGGHCVAQNAPLLGTRFAALLAELDGELRGKMQAPCSSTPTPPART